MAANYLKIDSERVAEDETSSDSDYFRTEEVNASTNVKMLRSLPCLHKALSDDTSSDSDDASTDVKMPRSLPFLHKALADKTSSDSDDFHIEDNTNTDVKMSRSSPCFHKALAQLTPRQELEYYRKKMDDFFKEVDMVRKEVDRCQTATLHNNELEKDLIKQTSTINRLQKSVSILQECLYEERERCLNLQLENIKLKIEIKEANALMDSISFKVGPRTLVVDTIPRVATKKHQRESNSDGDKEQKIEPKIFNTMQQLNKEFASHLEFIETDKELIRKEADRVIVRLRHEVLYLSARLKKSNDQLTQSVKDNMKWREEMRLKDVACYTELVNMRMSKLKVTEAGSSTLPGGGTDANYGQKRNISVLTDEITRLKEEVDLRDNLVEKYRHDLDTVRDQLFAEECEAKKIKTKLKDEISKALAHLQRQKIDYKNLEHRMMVECRGFHNAIKLVRSQVRDLERHFRQLSCTVLKLSKSPVTRSKKHTSAVNETLVSADTLRKGIREAKKKIEEVEAALIASK